MILEVKLWMKNESTLQQQLLETVKGIEPLRTGQLSICQGYNKLWIEIIPKDGVECHPWCKSTYSEYNPLNQIQQSTKPTFCFKNSTRGALQFNVDNRFTSCDSFEVDVLEYQGAFEPKEIVAKLDPSTVPEIIIKIDETVFIDHHYRIQYRLKQARAETIRSISKDVYSNSENNCSNTIPPETPSINATRSTPSPAFSTYIPPKSTTPLNPKIPTLTPSPAPHKASDLVPTKSSGPDPAQFSQSSGVALGFLIGVIFSLCFASVACLIWQKNKGRNDIDGNANKCASKSLITLESDLG